MIGDGEEIMIYCGGFVFLCLIVLGESRGTRDMNRLTPQKWTEKGRKSESNGMKRDNKSV